jgi:nucleotide-binding universal stress UspA family protein
VPDKFLLVESEPSFRGMSRERVSTIQPRLPPLSIGRACLGRPLSAASTARELPGKSSSFSSLTAPQLRSRAPAVLAEHILVTTDGSDSADHVIPFALAAIQACDSQRVTLLHVLIPKVGTPVHALDWAMQRAHAEASLEQFIERFDTTSALRDRINSVVVEGFAAEQILHFAEANEVDLIVIASHGSGDARTWSVGGTTHKVVASGVASMLVVPIDEATTAIRSVLVPLDCSARAEYVLPLAGRLAETHRAELVFAHVVPRPEVPHHLPCGQRERELIEDLTRHNMERAEAYLADVCARLAGRGISARSEVLVDTNPARAIEQLAKRSTCDLVLLCAHGSGCQPGERYGSTARRLLDSVVKPLWLVQDLPSEISIISQSHGGRPERA